MKNAWLDEIKIKETVENLSERLHKTFSGHPADLERWGEFLMLHLFTSHFDNHKIRDAVLTRYTFMYELDEDDKIIYLMLEKLPWFI